MKTILIIIFLILLVGCNSGIDDKFCQRLGYNESNGYGYTDDSIFNIKIKCDNKVIKDWTCHRTKECVNYNEYDRCIQKENGLWCNNYNGTDIMWIVP